jgi:hypothetical protein
VSPEDIQQAARLTKPDLYAKDRLGMSLHPKQAAVLRALFKKHNYVSFLCSNEVGKTTHVAAPAILYALEILGAQAISTAGVWMQVAQQLVPALKMQAHKFPDWDFQDSGIKIAGIDRYVGFSTRHEGFAQGFHRKEGMPLVAIVDEAAAVENSVISGVEERCNPDYFMLMGSPLDPVGTFYRSGTDLAKFYCHHSLNQTECLTTNGYWIDPATIERKVAKWGRDNPLVRSNIFGEWPDHVEGALLSIGEFTACLEWSRTATWHNDGTRHAFLDFAAGRAKNVFAVRIGNRVWIEKKWTDFNTMAAVGDFLVVFRKLQREFGLLPEECEGDADGLGKPMIDRLKEAGFNLQEFRGGRAPRYDDDYNNAISEAWGEGAGKIKKKEIIIPDDLDFRGQILGRKLKRNSSGKFQLESKEDMAKRGLESPDEADAILGAMMPCPQGSPRQVMGNFNKPHGKDLIGLTSREERSDHLPGTYYG